MSDTRPSSQNVPSHDQQNSASQLENNLADLLQDNRNGRVQAQDQLPAPAHNQNQQLATQPTIQPAAQALPYGFDDSLPYQFNVNGDPQLVIPHDQARGWRRRVTKAPEPDLHNDQTIQEVVRARETYISRMVKAVFNMQDVDDQPKSKDRNRFTRGDKLAYPELEVEASCRVLFDTVIDRCTNGYRGADRDNKAYTSRSKLEDRIQDRTGNCQTRMENVIKCLHSWKCACHDIMHEDYKLIMLANHPVYYFDMKGCNKRNNSTKAEAAREGRTARAQVHLDRLLPAYGYQQPAFDPLDGSANYNFPQTGQAYVEDEEDRPDSPVVVEPNRFEDGELRTPIHEPSNKPTDGLLNDQTHDFPMFDFDEEFGGSNGDVITPQDLTAPATGTQASFDGADYFAWPTQLNASLAYSGDFSAPLFEQHDHIYEGYIPANHYYGDYNNVYHHHGTAQHTPNVQSPRNVAAPHGHAAQTVDGNDVVNNANNEPINLDVPFQAETPHTNPPLKRRREPDIDADIRERVAKMPHLSETESPQKHNDEEDAIGSPE